MIENTSATERYFTWDPQKDPAFSPMIVGEGSIGGKGRSLLFAIRKLHDSEDPGLRKVAFPQSLFIAVGVFDAVIAALGGSEQFRNMMPEEIERRFLAAPLPAEVADRVREFLVRVGDPIIVRSSSLLEDSLKYSFAGKYLSLFEFNGDGTLEERTARVLDHIRRIYARTFFPIAVAYRAKHGLGDDGMGIILMRVSGKWRGRYYYPTVAGV